MLITLQFMKNIFLFASIFASIMASSQSLIINAAVSNNASNRNYCAAVLRGDSLTLENARIKRVFLWNGGDIITKNLLNKKNGKSLITVSLKPDMSFPGQSAKATAGSFSEAVIPATTIIPEHLEAVVVFTTTKLQIKRIFRIYPDCPAIACDVYLKGIAEKSWSQKVENAGDLKNIEEITSTLSAANTPVLEKLDFAGKHWKLDVVEFSDVTDRFNNLVKEVSALSYRNNTYRGNLLFATDQLSQNGYFILKEAPTSAVQLSYPGGDFLTNFGNIQVIGCGMDSSDTDSTKWIRAYGFVTGVFNDAGDRLPALRNYQQRKRLHLAGRDEMILMNTWGDRGQDTKVNETFCLAELEAGARLGITHFQLDDGWQTGKSANSAFKGGSFNDIWKNPDYWKPDKVKFPNGLQSLVEKGKELGIRICLWFNPSAKDNNGDWEKDAGALINMYQQYGITTFKIDGVKMPDKLSEINFRKMLDKVTLATGGSVVFNLDVTAGRRGGYNYFDEYGNIFLENRYTDWQNYYPYWTLRNLWMLARYVPPQNLQIEFLNKWRNADKYGNDGFAPANYSFDYLFAITMAAQPLAWFEATNLPAEAFGTSKTIKSYKAIMNDFHKGDIFPVGDEPSGKSWTGFQSQKPGSNAGYVLVFREQNASASFKFILPALLPGTYQFKKISGTGKSFSATVNTSRVITFQIDSMDHFVLFHYSKTH
jgi:alpha-galactosidase